MKKLLPLALVPASLPAFADPGHVGVHMEDAAYLLIGAALVAGTWLVRSCLRALRLPSLARRLPRRR
jgi:hypothetical protein